MPTLERAIAIAAEAHEGQTDKAGAPYILHVLRVVVASPAGDAKIAAALHDLVEDTDWTLDDLRERGFSWIVIDAVEALTRRADEVYSDYIERVAKNDLARKVKLADLRDNMDLNRFSDQSQINWSLQERYAKAVSRLLPRW